jgi:lipopolysaccharide biosynthesis glycosyltransferase
MNPGLIVLTPSRELTGGIHNYMATSPLIPTFSVPDQDLLAAFFKGKWKPLPWCYNALKTSRINHTPLWRDEEIRCLHYVFKDKPWKARVGEKGTGGEYEDINRWWWEMLDKLAEMMKVDDPDGWQLVLQRIAK